MSPLQTELTKLIGKKELSFGCILKKWDIVTEFISLTCNLVMTMYGSWLRDIRECEIIGHPATLSDFHRFLNSSKKLRNFHQSEMDIEIFEKYEEYPILTISYNSSKDLLDQEEETLKQIIDLIKYNNS